MITTFKHGTPHPWTLLVTPFGPCTYVSGPGENDDTVRLYMGYGRTFTVPTSTPWDEVGRFAKRRTFASAGVV